MEIFAHSHMLSYPSTLLSSSIVGCILHVLSYKSNTASQFVQRLSNLKTSLDLILKSLYKLFYYAFEKKNTHAMYQSSNI